MIGRLLKTIFSILIWPVWIAAFLISALAYLTAFLILPPKKLHPLVRLISRFLLFAGGQFLRVEGDPPNPEKGPYLYLFNHESMFDAFMMAAGIPHYFTAVGANYQFSWPVWGFVIRRYGIIPIKRKELGEAIQALEGAEEAIRKGVSFMLSPEGTRTLTGDLGPFKKGPFHIAKNTAITIVPVGLKGGFEAKPKPDWRIKPGLLKLRFGTPVTVEEYALFSVEELRDVIRDKIVKLVQE